MKKIYIISGLCFLFFFNGKSQLTLTKAFNEPIAGDVASKKGYDSTTSVPKNTGASQSWNFSSLTINTTTETVTYASPTVAPNYTAFPGAGLSEKSSLNTSYNMWKTSGANFEWMGVTDAPNTIISMTNTGIAYAWPVSMGYNNSDVFSGPLTSGTNTGIFNGTVTTNTSGTGTVTIPGGFAFSNCLQVVQTLTFVQATGASTTTNYQTEYYYFHSTQKFPILDITYSSNITGTMTSNSFDVRLNNAVLAKTENLMNPKNSFDIYPNPADTYMEIKTNLKEPFSFEITDISGRLIVSESNCDNNLNVLRINTFEFLPGLYFLSIKSSTGLMIKKFIIE